MLGVPLRPHGTEHGSTEKVGSSERRVKRSGTPQRPATCDEPTRTTILPARCSRTGAQNKRPAVSTQNEPSS
eukprot:3172022-Pleurochrysis_carterae.AAC.2